MSWAGLKIMARLMKLKYHLFINNYLVARDHTRILYLNPNEQLLKKIFTQFLSKLMTIFSMGLPPTPQQMPGQLAQPLLHWE